MRLIGGERGGGHLLKYIYIYLTNIQSSDLDTACITLAAGVLMLVTILFT